MTDDHNQDCHADISGLPLLDPADLAQGREPLETLASEFIEAVRKGENPRVDDFVSRHPELAAEIGQLFPLLGAMEGWKAYRARTSLEHRALDIVSSERFGEFRIIREIGRGAMGIVFEAEEQSTLRRVAVKVLPYLTSKKMREQFEREARTAARLSHPHIVPVFNFGEFDGLWYYVMQLIRGVSLDWLIRRMSRRQAVLYPREIVAQFSTSARSVDDTFQDAPLAPLQPTPTTTAEASPTIREASPDSKPLFAGLGRNFWSEMATIAAQVAGALEYAHSQGTLHRDIKPANVLIDAAGNAWLTDFGLAKNTDELIAKAHSNPAGTLRYIAPEQFAGRIDARSDIYSLGVTLFELLTRTPAFLPTDEKRLVEVVLSSSVLSPRERNRSIPRDLDAIVAKATAREPALRYTSAAALRADLERFARRQRVHAHGVMGWLPFAR